MFSVYCHENKANGKTYVGITGQDPKHRWLNGAGYSRNKKFHADIQKYGWDGFNHRIVCNGLTEEQAVAIEKEMIAAFDARHLGYNNDDGGKYTPKRNLCHEANEIKRGIKTCRYEKVGGAKNVMECFQAAERAGKESELCQCVNMVTQAIVSVFTKAGRQLAYADPMFIADFVWEWNRYWKISEFIHSFGVEAANNIDINKVFPPYNSRERYEQMWRKVEIA